MIHWLLESKTSDKLKSKEWISLKALCKRSNRYAVFKLKDLNTIHAEIIRMRFKKHFQVPYPGIEPVTFSMWGGIVEIILGPVFVSCYFCFDTSIVIIIIICRFRIYSHGVESNSYDTFITNRLTHCCSLLHICYLQKYKLPYSLNVFISFHTPI